jgi:outer membrane protein assembly factor BamB
MTDIEYHANENLLTVVRVDGSEADVATKWPIAEVISVGQIIVVRTSPPPGSCDNENVFAVNANGELIWTVPPRRYVYSDSPFVGIVAFESNVKLFNWDGTELVVDSHSGRILKDSYGK